MSFRTSKFGPVIEVAGIVRSARVNTPIQGAELEQYRESDPSRYPPNGPFVQIILTEPQVLTEDLDAEFAPLVERRTWISPRDQRLRIAITNTCSPLHSVPQVDATGQPVVGEPYPGMRAVITLRPTRSRALKGYTLSLEQVQLTDLPIRR